MTASAVRDTAGRAGTAAAARPAPGAAVADLKASLRELLSTLLRTSVGIALDQVEGLASSLDGLGARGGAGIGALLGGLKARLAGTNPIWGAVKGAIGSLSPAARVAIVAALVLAIVLLPVTVVLLLIALIVVIVVVAASSR